MKKIFLFKSDYDRKNQIASRMVFFGGCIITVIGISHFPMASDIFNHKEFDNLSAISADYLILSVIGVGILLINFGILSLYFSSKLKLGEKSARVFCLCQGVMWVIRSIFEVMFPVRVPIFHITTPTYLLLPVVFLLAFIFLIPVVITGKNNKD